MSSPPPTDPDSDSPPFFASGASPPLIIGFIAIGAFSLGILSLCIWRRASFRRIDTGAFRAGRERRHKEEEGAERPVLYEVWREGAGRKGAAAAAAEVEETREVGEEKRRGEGGLRWADVMPISATLEPSHAPIVHPPPSPSSPSSPPPPRRPSSSWTFRRRFRRPQPRDIEAAEGLAAAQKPSSDPSQKPPPPPAIERGTLHVAVLLAMPAPPDEPRSDDDDGRAVEYALGLVRVPWTRECAHSGQTEAEGSDGPRTVQRKSESGFVYC